MTTPSAEADSRIRLLTVTSALGIGGLERIAACLTARVDNRRFAAAACYLRERGSIGDQMLAAGVDAFPLPGLAAGRPDYLTAIKLRRVIRARQIQIIHTHDVHGLADAAICRLTTPGLRHIHTFHYGNYPERAQPQRTLERLCWRVPDAIVAVGRGQAAALRDTYHIPANRLQVIWNGVDDALPSSQPSPVVRDLAPDIPVIASISTMIPQKGLEHLLEATALLRASGDEFVLLVVGDGALRPQLTEKAVRLGLAEQVRFLGWVPDAARQVLPACDIFVQSSLWEAMSIVVLEAMSAGRPMVLTAVGENPHAVVPGESGLIVPPADPVALADALRSLLRDPLKRMRLGQNARVRYEQRFRHEYMVTEYERLYCEVLGLSSPTGRPQDDD